MKKFAVLGLGVLLAGCFGSEPKDAEEALEDKGVLDVLQEAGEDEYDPPADGKLTRDQVAMYLEVKKRERDLAKVAAEKLKETGQELKDDEEEGASFSAALKGLGALRDLTNFVTADIRAAQELGHNTAEYSWVKQQVLEAGLATWSQNVRQQTGANLETALQQMKDARDKAPNEEMRKFYDQQIENYEKVMAEQKQQDEEEDTEALRHNQELLSEFGGELKLLEDEIKKYGLAGAFGQEEGK